MNKIDNSNTLKILNPLLNKLSNTSLCLSDLLGIICYIIYSKDIFPKNRDLMPFLNKVFNISFLEYVINSRTLIVARITKYVYLMDEKESVNIPLKIIEYFKAQQVANPKQNKKRNANDKLETWLKGF
jgi:hypothetical protein